MSWVPNKHLEEKSREKYLVKKTWQNMPIKLHLPPFFSVWCITIYQNNIALLPLLGNDLVAIFLRSILSIRVSNSHHLYHWIWVLWCIFHADVVRISFSKEQWLTNFISVAFRGVYLTCISSLNLCEPSLLGPSIIMKMCHYFTHHSHVQISLTL